MLYQNLIFSFNDLQLQSFVIHYSKLREKGTLNNCTLSQTSKFKTNVGPGVVRVSVVTHISSTINHVAGEILISCCTRFSIFIVALMRIMIFWEVTLSR